MKKIVMGLVTSSIIGLSIPALADRVVITGVQTPTYTMVESRDNMYVVPADTTLAPVSGYYFLNMGSTEKVCSMKAVPTIGVDVPPIMVRMGTADQKLYCYDKTYFDFK